MTSSLIWPSLLSLPLLYVSYVALAALLWKRKLWAAGFIFGVCWINSHALYYQSWIVDIQQKAANFSIHGVVLAVDNNQYWQKVTLQVDQLDTRSSLAWWKPKLSLYHSPQNNQSQILQPGQSIQAIAKLKPVFASINPAGFNYARWLVSKSMVGRGSLVSHQVLGEQVSFRERWVANLAGQLSGYKYGGELLALMVGDKRLLNSERRTLYQQSGLGHLFVLSGLHLGIAAMWSWWLFRLIGLVIRMPHASGPLIASFGCCLIYCWLANWQLSMMRALLMYGCLLVFGLTTQRRNLASGIVVSAFIILLLWPFSLYSNGFWLSYTAVSSVLLCLWLGPSNKLLMLVLIQAMIGIAMLPIQVAMFGQLPSGALLLNLVAVPLFSVILVPLNLLLMLGLSFDFPSVENLAELLNNLFAVSFRGLDFLAGLQAVSFTTPIALLGLCVLLFSVLLTASAVGRRFAIAYLTVLLLVPLFNSFWPRSLNWQVYVLDVGQGLAVVIEHNNQALIFDSGPRFRSGFSYAESVILPLLVDLRVEYVTAIVTSHGDNDHAGGRSVLEEAFPKALRFYGRDKRLPDERCNEQMKWGELALTFRMANLGEGNNGSCTLRIFDGNYSLLLTGDIEQMAEQQLLAEGLTKVSFLLSPHHGSNSSSSNGFINALQPEIVMHSSGAYNRFGFPHTSVTERYSASEQFVTGKGGAIHLEIGDRSYQVTQQRYLTSSPWYQQIISW
ncbi:DNA internalization-related competence protein ComEC/Rec2 [Agarivorans sp. Toyoura001]|uniref:DNA internalization-related competence protein ComEC/Rec2 n=1 Tax=Agarivorans sp. Toyoura001 TaxID=2283141 RepID=UPI0013871172|nr:DNA internalization-related competence protein ComEC/Rec2 [Agarivorans sp. Toyoura001]